MTLPKNPRFETYVDKAGAYRWRLRARNGLIVADSAEGYDKKSNALRAATVVRRMMRGALPIPIVHWEVGQKDVGGRRPASGLGPRAAALPQGEP